MPDRVPEALPVDDRVADALAERVPLNDAMPLAVVVALAMGEFVELAVETLAETVPVELDVSVPVWLIVPVDDALFELVVDALNDRVLVRLPVPVIELRPVCVSLDVREPVRLPATLPVLDALPVVLLVALPVVLVGDHTHELPVPLWEPLCEGVHVAPDEPAPVSLACAVSVLVDARPEPAALAEGAGAPPPVPLGLGEAVKDRREEGVKVLIKASRRMRFLLSVMNKLPPLSTATPSGLSRLALVAGPPSPLKPRVPVPANVAIMPVFAATRRMR